MVNEDLRKRNTYQPRTVQSVRHAAELLRAIGSRTEPRTLSELARIVELSKPATYNLLNTLIAEGMVTKDEKARYRLDWGLYELGSALDVANELKKAARFSLDRLAESFGGAALLSILSAGTVLYLDRGQLDPEFSMVANTGKRSPLHTNASGKVLLANADEITIRAYLSVPLKAKTTTTVTDPRKLINELSQVREDGYGACWGEQEPLLSSIAVPIFDANNIARASLAVAVPTQKFRTMSRTGLVSKMRDESSRISRALAWQPGGAL